MIRLTKLLKEVITIDVEIGDTILTGRFKNKKTVVKSIEKDEYGMPTINGRKIVSFRKMQKQNEELVTERIDFYEVANEVIKKHNLKSKVQFTTSKGSKADYNVDTDTITIKPTNNVKDFFESLLHEIHHAMMAKKHGKKNYVSKYEMEMNLKAGEGKDPYDQNPYEIRAEKYGKKYAQKWMKRLDVN